MIKLIEAKCVARQTIKERLQAEIPKLNELIKKASEEGKFCVVININDYSESTRVLLKKAGYKVEYDYISWAHLGVKIDENECDLMEIAEDAGFKIWKFKQLNS